MPPDGDTTVTVSEETTAKRSRVMVRHEVESMSLAICEHTKSIVSPSCYPAMFSLRMRDVLFRCWETAPIVVHKPLHITFE
jgi:hypothetical protein